MLKYYIKRRKCLACIHEKATSEFWDNRWNDVDINDIKNISLSKYDYIINTTSKYLKKGSTVLEGGCGTGKHVWKLYKCGYNVIGIDYAIETVKKLNKDIPELNVVYGDLEDLNFIESNSIDGFWSIGVIEHNYYGYSRMITEMNRVIKKNGYIFMTFPHMSRIRKIKSYFGMYPEWNESLIESFYQYNLNEQYVINDFKNMNFKLISARPQNGVLGLKEESAIFKKIYAPIEVSHNKSAKYLRTIISDVAAIFASHVILLIFKKSI